MTFPRVTVARCNTHMCILAPVCFLDYLTELVDTVVSSKKETDDDPLIHCRLNFRNPQAQYQYNPQTKEAGKENGQNAQK